jgi:hypothetical protein
MVDFLISLLVQQKSKFDPTPTVFPPGFRCLRRSGAASVVPIPLDAFRLLRPRLRRPHCVGWGVDALSKAILPEGRGHWVERRPRHLLHTRLLHCPPRVLENPQWTSTLSQFCLQVTVRGNFHCGISTVEIELELRS